jgi:hypothetical protein
MASTGAVADRYNTIMASGLDLFQPQLLNEIYRPHGDQGLAYLKVRSLGFERPVSGESFGHFEENDATDKIKVATITGGGVGAACYLTLDASSVDADYKYYPSVGDVLVDKYEVNAWIDSISDNLAGTVILKCIPFDATDDFSLGITTGTELGIYSSEWPQASAFPQPKVSTHFKYTNTVKIMKQKIGATGTELITQTYIPQYNAAGVYQGSYFPAAQFDIDYRMMTDIDGMFWLGQKVTQTGAAAIPAYGQSGKSYPNKGTEGLLPAIRRAGNTYTVAAGAIAITNFDYLDRLFIKGHINPDIPIWMAGGVKRIQEIENAMVTYFTNSNIDYQTKVINDRLFHGDASLGASVNWKYFQKSMRTFLLDRLDGWSNPKTYGISGQYFEDTMVGIPLTMKRDPKTGGDIPTIGIRYAAMGDYNRRMITARMSGIGATHGNEIPVQEIDETNTYQVAHMGCEFFGVENFVIMPPV